MSCNTCDKSGCSCAVLQRGFKATDTRAIATVTLHPKHNRFRVHVTPASTVTAGDVTVDVGIYDPESPQTVLWARAGTVAYNAAGGQLVGQLAPVPHQLRLGVSGYVGTAELAAVVESWTEGA